MQKVVLHVSGTEWTQEVRVLDNLAATLKVENPPFQDEEDWAVVAGPVGKKGSCVL